MLQSIVYTCPFVPAEWILAHGLRPRRVLPEAPDGTIQGMCPFAEGFLAAVTAHPDARAAVFTTTCDQMRRASEFAARAGERPVFLLHVPATWKGTVGRDLYVDELLRLGRFLVSLGGTAPADADLARVMREHDDARQPLRAPRNRTSTSGVPLALVGGSLFARFRELFDLVESLGGRIALDATSSGERGLPAPFDPDAMRSDPLGALADAYFGGIPDAFRRPNDRLYEWLAREIAERRIRGILFLHPTWCDTWLAEADRMRRRFGLPLSVLETGGSGSLDARTRMRVEALLEAVR